MNKQLILGDCIEVLKTLPDNSIDSVVTDPPYHLTSVVKRFGKPGSAPAKDKDGLFKRQSKGFMGQEWDGGDIAFRTEVWEECLRVLKPGGHLLAFSASRNYHRMGVAIEDAGFEIRDQLQWIYGSGFPKSHNIGKAVDKKLGNERKVVGENPNHRTSSALYELGFQDGKGDGQITKGNSEWEGWGTALKPAHEPIVMARKPLSEKTIVGNVLEWGTGGINIDESRIPLNTDGRFPANIILSEEAAENLDQHTGALKGDSPNRKPRNGGHREKYVGTDNNDKKQDVISDKTFTDSHLGASKFFYVAKPSKKEKDLGIDKNNHPTVKPIKLMEYLIKLVTPKGGTTLDPFMGSGTTGIAALTNGFNFIGIEMGEEYMDIAEQRINAWTKEIQTKMDI